VRNGADDEERRGTMTKELTIYWDDLNDKKKKEIIEEFGDNFNWDYFPICTLDIEIDDEEEKED
jgi:hypothetical protein